MLRLNFALYSGGTLLRDWWRQVKTHFTEMQDAHNALETRLGEESERLGGLILAEETARQNGDNALSGRINSEKSDRESAESALRQSISDKAAELNQSIADSKAELNQSIADSKAELNKSISDTSSELYKAVGDETRERMSADASIAAQIGDETAARQNADGQLESRMGILESTAHMHENAAVLDTISEDDVAAWRDKTDFDAENRLMIAYLFELLKGYKSDMCVLYGELGVTVYDGGLMDGSDAEEAIILDGGDFEEADTAEIDFSTFDESVVALAQVLDGGQY